MTVDDLNALDRARFVDAIGWVVEHAPWVAERAWARRPFASVDDVHHAMMLELNGASRPEQVAVLRAHPDLGARAKMTDSSTAEQAGAGLDRLAPADVQRLHQLNHAYREKFGFPFLFAVKGSTATQIRAALESRLASTPGAEFDEAMRQVSRIARFRLEETLSRASVATKRAERR